MGKCLGALCLMIILTGSGVAGEKTIIVRGQDFPPYHYMGEDNRETGFLIDMIVQVGQSMGLDIQFKQRPWSRCLQMVKKGEADAMMNLFQTPERQTFMYFSQTPLAREVNRFYVRDTSKIQFTGRLSQLHNYKIGAVRNYSYGKEFDQYATNLNLLRLETEKALILNLMGERCDIILGNEVVLATLARQMNTAKQLKPIGPGLTDTPLYIGFSKAKGHKDLAESFSNALKAFKATPRFSRILTAYQL